MGQKAHGCTLTAWLLTLALALCAALPAIASPTLRLDAGETKFSLSPVLQYWHDQPGHASVEQAFAHTQDGAFAPLPNGNPAFGFQTGAYWFYLPIENMQRDDPRWLLVQEYALSDNLDLYLRYPDGHIEHQQGGDHVPFYNRFVRFRHPNFRLDLPAGTRVELLLRVQSESSMQVPLVLYTPQAFAELMRDTQFANGLYYGIVLALLCYNLVLWLMLRDSGYFWYLLHTLAFGLVLFTLNGYGFEYLWPTSAWMADAAVPLSICLALMGMQMFSRSFLDLAARWSAGNIACLVMVGVFGAMGIASIWLPYSTATPLVSRAVLLGIAWILTASVVMLLRGFKPARLFLLAWALFLIGTTAFTLLAFAVVPQSFWTQYGVQIGSALELLLLSLALGHRYAGLRNANIRLVHDANERLERGLVDRTRELRTTLAQLGEANVKLQEFSRRDPLTGAYNRRHFHETLSKALEATSSKRKSQALLLLDIDHFKRINDQYGHLVGDDCLKAVSRCIHDIAQTLNGMAARYGGEEFVLILPGTDARMALQTAETVRLRIQQTIIHSHGHVIQLSTSIGVHTIGAEQEILPEEAIRLADEALYRAKHDGRNCVRHSMVVV
jgi:diguanylate cyclase